MSECPALFFKHKLAGHKRQQEFLEASRKYKRVLFLGANQSGKSTIGTIRALAWAIGYEFWRVPDLKLTPEGDFPPREQIPLEFWCKRTDGVHMAVPNLGVVITGLKRAIGIGEVLWPSLNNAVPLAWRSQRLGWKVLKGSIGVAENITLPNGSRIIFASEEQETWTFEGFTAHWAWVDEPVRKEIFNAMQARLLANSGPMAFTLTPLGSRSAWMMPLAAGEDPDTFVVTVTQLDNPGLTDEQRHTFANNSQWSDREKRARLYGEFEVLGDRVFEDFDPSVHVVPARPVDANADLIHGLTVDPHHRRPAYMLWWTYDPAARSFHFYREWPADRDFFKATDGGLPPLQYATIIRNAEGGVPARARVVDPRFGKSEHTQHGFKSTSWVDQMAAYGLVFDANVPNTGTVEYGHQVIQELLHFDRNFPLGPTNRPRLTISEDCKNLITGFKMYGFLDVKDPVKGLFRKVSEEYKDVIDCVRYTVLYPIPATAAQLNRLQRWTPEELEQANNGD